MNPEFQDSLIDIADDEWVKDITNHLKPNPSIDRPGLPRIETKEQYDKQREIFERKYSVCDYYCYHYHYYYCYYYY